MMKFLKKKLGDKNGTPISFWSTDDNVLCEDGKTLRENLDEVDTRFKDITSYKINIKDFGAIGDGVNDDTITIQNALNKCKDMYDNYNVKCTLYFPQGLYKITSTLTLSNTSFNLKMDGYLYLDKNIKYGFVFDRLKNIFLDLKIKGNNMNVSDFNYSKDWASNVQGLNVGVRLVGCTSINLNSEFDEFYGRGIESEGSWQFDFGYSKGKVGQFIFIKKTSGQGLLNSGIGNIGSVHVEEIVGSYFNGDDINITYYENYIPKATQALGVRFEECTSLWVTNMSIGYFGNDYVVGIDRCKNFDFAHLYCYGQYTNGIADENAGSGLSIQESQSGNINLMTSACKSALRVNGLLSTIINWTDNLSRDLGQISSTETYEVKGVTINLNSKSRLGKGLEIINNSNGNNIIDGLTINANSIDRNAVSTDIYDIHIKDETSIVYINGKLSNLDLQTNNKCIVNCKYDTINNRALIDLKTVAENKNVTCINNSYSNALGIQNKITRLGNIVFGTFAIEHPSKTGQLTRDALLVSLPPSLHPQKQYQSL